MKEMQKKRLKYRKEVFLSSASLSIELINEMYIIVCMENLHHRLLIYLTYILRIFNIR